MANKTSIINEILLYPKNSPGNRVIKRTATGDPNLLNILFFKYIKALNKNKESYIFEYNGHYYWNLTMEEHKEAKLLIENFK